MATGPRPTRPSSEIRHDPTGRDVRRFPSVPTTRSLVLVLVVLAAGACDDAADGGAPGSERPDGWRGVRLEEPVPMPEATLTDTRGDPYRLKREAEGRVTLLFFGYTHCPDVCPVQMANLGAVLEEMPPASSA